jgi:DNA-binding CsgD family transcriptional regulator
LEAFSSGDWERSRREARSSLVLAPTKGPHFERQQCLGLLAMIELETGNSKAARDLLQEVAEDSGSPEAPLPFLAPKIAWITGDDTGLDLAVTALAQATMPRDFPFSWLPLASGIGLALAAVVKGDKRKADHWLGFLRRYQGLFLPGGPAGVSVDRLMGLLCMTAGREFSQASNHFEKALAFCRGSGYRPELAWSCYDYGRALAVTREGQDCRYGRQVLEEAHSIAKELGMGPLRHKIEAQLRRLTGHPVRSSHNSLGLTERQVEVLKLASRGFTNSEIGEQLFISPETVARHMHNILGRTGMSNRTEATALAMREGLVD